MSSPWAYAGETVSVTTLPATATPLIVLAGERVNADAAGVEPPSSASLNAIRIAVPAAFVVCPVGDGGVVSGLSPPSEMVAVAASDPLAWGSSAAQMSALPLHL